MIADVFRRRRARRDDGQVRPSAGAPAASAHDVMLAETIARHFEGADVVGAVARLGFGGVEIGCEVASVSELGDYHAASLFFRISGGPLGQEPVFASISGYEQTVEDAIVAGGCNWACTFGPVLRAGLTGARPEPDSSVDDFTVILDGRRFRVVVDGMDRAFLRVSADPAAYIAATRDRLGGHPWLTTHLLESGLLPLLTAPGATLLSVFRSEAEGGGLAEVKVNGADWEPLSGERPRAGTRHPDGAGDPGGLAPGQVLPDDGAVMAVLLRELAVLTPLDPPTLERAAVQRTLDGLDLRRAPRQTAGWPGWAAHGGWLGEVLDEPELARIQSATGPLPTDYVRFLTQVAGPGAGPGYGLVRPERHGDAVPLAHAGCGVTWVLRLDRERYGTVWADAGGSDGTYSQVAASFTDWFAAWLEAAVRDLGPWISWDVRCCATAEVLAQILTDLEKQAPLPPGEPIGLAGDVRIQLTNGGGYLPAGSPGDPCHGCVNLAAQFDLMPDVFAPGVLSRSAPATGP